MSLLVLDQRPVVLTVCQYIVLDDLILGCIIRILTDTACKFGVVGINTSVNHRNGNAAARTACPYVLQIHVVQIGLLAIIRIGHSIGWAHRKAGIVLLVLFPLNQITDPDLIVCRHLLQIREVFLITVHVQNSRALGQGKRGKSAVLVHAQGRTEFFCQLCRFYIRSIIQHNALCIVRALVPLQLGNRIIAIFLLNLDLLLHVCSVQIQRYYHGYTNK